MDYKQKLFSSWVTLVGLGIACCTLAGEPQFLPQSSLDDGWISLFDGETKFGWQPSGEATWEVADGVIHTDGSKPGWLMTTTEWTNFDLHVEFLAFGGTNSGVFVRTALKPTDPAKDCYEVNIAPPDNPYPTGSIVARQKLAMGDPERPKIKLGVWHSFDLHIVGGEFKVSLDGIETVTYTDSQANPSGYIGLQSKEGTEAFRNVRLRPLGLKTIFDGKSLKGWSTDRAKKCKFDITKEGELHMSNGPGQIDTVSDFMNFVLQIDCKANGDGLNSGVFFRTLREGWCAGYESQIQNGFKDGERTKPKDYGTGAIYRRQAARYVVPNDHEWFTKTIVADGPHMAVWVNGYQVSDWTDTRPPKENAREGRRDAGGAIALQGHDPTTDFLFRNIRAVELPR